MKKYILIVLIFLGIFFSGCLSSEENINSESLDIIDVEWLGPSGVSGCGDGIGYNLAMRYNGEINSRLIIYMYVSKSSEPIDLDGEGISIYECVIDRDRLVNGEYIYRGIYRNYDLNEEGKLYLFIYGENGKLIKTKIIDAPYYDVKIIPPNGIIYSSDITYDSTPYYLTLENTGNMPALFRIGQTNHIEDNIEESGIYLGYADRDYKFLSPSNTNFLQTGEKEKYGLWLTYVNKGDINLGDSGITEISAGYEYQKKYYECDSVRIKWVADEL